MVDRIQEVRDMLFDAVVEADRKGGSAITLRASQVHQILDALAASPVPKGHALVSEGALQALGVLDQLREAARFPVAPRAPADYCTEENCTRCKTLPVHRTRDMFHAGIGKHPWEA